MLAAFSGQWKVGSAMDDELGDGILSGDVPSALALIRAVPSGSADDLLVLGQRQEEPHELVAVWRRDSVQHLRHEVPARWKPMGRLIGKFLPLICVGLKARIHPRLEDAMKGKESVFSESHLRLRGSFSTKRLAARSEIPLNCERMAFLRRHRREQLSPFLSLFPEILAKKLLQTRGFLTLQLSFFSFCSSFPSGEQAIILPRYSYLMRETSVSVLSQHFRMYLTTGMT